MISQSRRFRRAVGPEPVLAATLVALWVVLAVTCPDFRRPGTYLEMLRYCSEIGIVCLPMTLVILTGGIDLSVGAMVALCSMALGLSWRDGGLGVWAATGLAVALGCVAGALNGMVIVGFRIPPLIVTLGTMAVYRGIAMGLCAGTPVSGYPEAFSMLGRGHYELPGGLQLPGQTAILAALAMIAGVALARTRFGRYIYAIGLKEPSARYAAVPVDAAKLCVYTLSGAACGLAAAILTSRLNTSKPDLAQYFELDVITACVVGGVSIMGGRGSIVGSMLGLLLLRSLRSGLDSRDVPNEYQSLWIGVVLVLAVFLHQVLVPAVRNRLQARRRQKEDPT